MKTYLLPSLKLSIILVILCSAIYPLFVSAVAMAAPGRGKGVTIKQNGRTVGYENIGQLFSENKYFWGRHSAVKYNAAGSGGSNKGALNSAYMAEVSASIDSFLVHNPGVKRSEVPTELVTASGSGLDPNISVQAAKVQVPRISRARSMSEEEISSLISRLTEKPLLGFLGPEKINVLKLNIELDK